MDGFLGSGLIPTPSRLFMGVFARNGCDCFWDRFCRHCRGCWTVIVWILHSNSTTRLALMKRTFVLLLFSSGPHESPFTVGVPMAFRQLVCLLAFRDARKSNTIDIFQFHISYIHAHRTSIPVTITTELDKEVEWQLKRLAFMICFRLSLSSSITI